jgi:DUF1680 family protein
MMNLGRGTVILALILWATETATFASAPPAPPRALERAPGLKLDLGWPVTSYARNITRNWLLVAPESNPGMLGMLRDRDRAPYRDLLPWSGEFAGKYLTGATQVLRLTNDPALRARLEAFVPEMIACQDEADGYLGPFPRDSRLTGSAPNIQGKPGGTWDAWGHYHAMLGLITWSDLTGDREALAAARRIGDLLCDRFLGEKSPRLVDTGATEMNLAPAHALMLLHERTGEPRHRDLARQLIEEFTATAPDGKPLAGDYLRAGLAGVPFFQTPKPRWESLHPMLALAEVGAQTGSKDHVQAFESLWWSIVATDRHNNGGFSSGEQAQGDPFHRGAIETCCTIAWMALTLDRLRLTGDPKAADELELSTLNSVLGLYSPSGRWSTYDTPMDGTRRSSTQDIVFQARPGTPELNCCSVNAARGVGLLSEWALMSTRDGGLALNWYGPGTMRASVGEGQNVTLRIDSSHPGSGHVEIGMEFETTVSFPLKLRVPAWSERTSLTVNGEAITDVRAGSYVTLARDWKTGDRLALDLDMAPRAWVGERACADRVSIYRGPVLLTFDPVFNASIAGGDPPPIDLKALGREGWGDPIAEARAMVAVDVPAIGGGRVRLVDFASAGADGSPYRSWLRAGPMPPPLPFSMELPLPARRLGEE